MAIIKCKMCGGDLNLVEGQSVAECEYCGSRQTVPAADDQKKLERFARAREHLFACEFDRAASAYELIADDFPEEAEAYWGAVLCKYGVDYVEDPATRKYVPTCHRSSFESVLEDPNYKRALEYADVSARELYILQARELEKVRAGIVAASAKEQPYDVFICYKETDANNKRTLDSVLAQKIYDALTERKYRAFFARISLKTRLGEAYEPVIFAALNSAKVMLAVGTRSEYYEAVWVKNEWSRYLKICTADREKVLIPCYKDMTIAEMPQEFHPLEAVDLGQLGAIQDIVANIERRIPRVKESVQRERGSTWTPRRKRPESDGDDRPQVRVENLLDRGYMALEDGDWKIADRFFEEALNNDARNGSAYWGKALATENCRTLDDFIQKRERLYKDAQRSSKQIEKDFVHIRKIINQYQIPRYLEPYEIQSLYDVKTEVLTFTESRREQLQKEQRYWSENKLLARAAQFADDETMRILNEAKKRLFDCLEGRIAEAEKDEAEKVQRIKALNDEVYKQADQKAAVLHEQAARKQKEDFEKNDQEYNKCVEMLKAQTTADGYRMVGERFKRLGSHRNSQEWANHCVKLAEETIEKQKALEFQNAMEAMKNAKCSEDYLKAAQQFDHLKFYRGANSQAAKCRKLAEETLWKEKEQEFQAALEIMKNAKSSYDYNKAAERFKHLRYYRAKEMAEECKKLEAECREREEEARRLKKRNRKILFIMLAALLVFVVFFIIQLFYGWETVIYIVVSLASIVGFVAMCIRAGKD